MSCADSLGDPAGDLVSVLRLAVGHMTEIEGILLDLVGIAVIGAGGWLETRCRDRWARARAARQSGGAPSAQVP